MPLALDEKIAALARALEAADIPHAFGGALALAYYATPRGTHDIDLNVFVPEAKSGPVLRALAKLGIDSAAAKPFREARTRGQTRVRWEHTPLDLFFSYDPLHQRCAERIRRVPFGEGVTLAILAAEDLAIFKALFDRPKDWNDIADMLFALGADFDTSYTTEWLRKILAPDDARLARFEALLREPH